MKAPQLSIQMGAVANAQGVLFVVYFSKIIAILDAHGGIIAMTSYYPMYLIEYLIALPTPEQVRRN